MLLYIGVRGVIHILSQSDYGVGANSSFSLVGSIIGKNAKDF